MFRWSLVCLIATFPLGGCFAILGEPSREQVAWARSPDGGVHAILIETNGGATTSFGYAVELHPAAHRGERPVGAGTLYAATRSDCAYGVDLHWLSPTRLAIRFADAQAVDIPASVDVGGRTIRIVAQSGHINEAAPCGGMADAEAG